MRTFSAKQLGILASALVVHAALGSEWNQWLGGPARSLSARSSFTNDSPPAFVLAWRRPLGSGVAGVSVFGTHLLTAMTDGRQDVAVLLAAATGAERWRFPVSRTKKRGEGVVSGPLSTPALDAESAYVQALDGRFVCLDLKTGALRWEVNLKQVFKAYEPGYGFASSPLLLDDWVILLPAGSGTCSVAALDRRTGELRWKCPLGTSTQYASATGLIQAEGSQVVAHLGTKLAGLAATDGRILWELDNVAGGLWTPSVLCDGRLFFPTAQTTRLLEPNAKAARETWTSPVFESVMGPVVELKGLLVGHHGRRLTALNADTGTQLWQQPEETDGQLLVLGNWLVFVHDRAGELELRSVNREGSQVVRRQALFKPTRMETPLTFAHGILYVRTPQELIALRAE